MIRSRLKTSVILRIWSNASNPRVSYNGMLTKPNFQLAISVRVHGLEFFAYKKNVLWFYDRIHEPTLSDTLSTSSKVESPRHKFLRNLFKDWSQNSAKEFIPFTDNN